MNKDKTIAALLAQRDSTSAQLDRVISEREMVERECAQRGDELDRMHRDYDNMRARVAERDATIAALVREIGLAKADHDELQGALDEATETIADLRAMIDAGAFAKPAEVLDLEALGYDGVNTICVFPGDVITPNYDNTEQYRVTRVHRVIEDYDNHSTLIYVDVIRPDGTERPYTEFDGSWVVWRHFGTHDEQLENAS